MRAFMSDPDDDTREDLAYLASTSSDPMLTAGADDALDEARAILAEVEPWDGPDFCFRGELETGRVQRTERLALAESLAAFVEE